ncbi:MAG: hypothetical protein LUF84_04955 [Clostridiales bacterium]|nr:hypothetical protein [Clostridiales bacterium]
MERSIETKCIYRDGAKFEAEQTGFISFPIYQTATFAHLAAVGAGAGASKTSRPWDVRRDSHVTN